jgi:catechol 2,3-dioxygenase-like lactoylglutathione lyase family enzyme
VTVRLDHTIVHARDKDASAQFLADILGLPAPTRLEPFAIVRIGDGTTLDFMNSQGDIAQQHYAFLVSESEFDTIFGRIRARQLPYWADPSRREQGRINTWDGGRGVYFEDPNGHLLEAITRSYGTGGTTTDRPHPLFRSGGEK